MYHVSADPPADVIRKRGTVLVFPSLVMHGIEPVHGDDCEAHGAVKPRFTR